MVECIKKDISRINYTESPRSESCELQKSRRAATFKHFKSEELREKIKRTTDFEDGIDFRPE